MSAVVINRPYKIDTADGLRLALEGPSSTLKSASAGHFDR